MYRQGFSMRIVALLRGALGTKLQNAEARYTEAVYHDAIEQRQQQYDRLKESVARLAYLRSRIESDMRKHREDLQLVEQALAKAVQANDDTRALALIRKKRTLSEDVDRLEAKLRGLTEQTEQAKKTLKELAQVVQQLKDEQTEMLSRKARAEARLHISRVFQQSAEDSPDADVALENAREAIIRLEHMADFDANLGQAEEGDVSLLDLRREVQDETDLQTLATLKQEMSNRFPS